MKSSALVKPLLMGVCAAVALVTTSLGANATAGSAERPNILLIFADDLGWTDVGYNGSPYFETPNIDRLAKEGMVFTAGYAAAGNCAPSRACLISGNYSPRHHVYAVGSTDRGQKELMRMEPIPNQGGLAPENITVADALKAAGYATGIFGKWHLSGRGGAQPGEQGFDVVMDQNYPGSGAKEDPKGIYTITSAACEFLENNQDKPFFAYVAHHAIHTGWQAKQETLSKFEAKMPADEEVNALYAACAADLDDGVGILLAKLAELGLAENTLVVFTSDNGRIAYVPQEPLRGGKGSYYEGGIRVPFIVRWPGVVKPRSRSAVPVINVDLYPTFLAAAGAPVPSGKVLDGESLLPVLKGEGELERQAIFWHFPGYLDGPVNRGRDPVFRTRAVSTIRKGDWKLLLYHEEWQLDGGAARLDTNHAAELYNLRADAGEYHDLAGLNPGMRDELLGDLLSWFERTDALLPTKKNPKYDPNAKPTGGRRRANRAAGNE